MFRPAAALVGIAVASVAVAAILPSWSLDIATRVLILGLFAMSLDLLLGRTGLWSLGHAAFFGAGSYAVALFAAHIHHNFFLAVAVAITSGVAIAAASGLIALRSRGLYFMLVTLALAQVGWALAARWRGLTHGDDGLPGIVAPDLAPLPLKADEPLSFYILTLAIFSLSVAALWLIRTAPFGASLAGIREHETRMRVLGYDVVRHSYVAYIVAGGFAALAGALFAYHNGIVTPHDLSVSRSAEALLMVVLGGPGTLFGPLLGAALVVALQQIVGIYTDRWLTVFGATLILAIIFTPNGVWRIWEVPTMPLAARLVAHIRLRHSWR